MPDNESSAKIDTAISEAFSQFKQRTIELDAEVEADRRPIEAVRQLIKDLDAAVQRIRGARRIPNRERQPPH